MAEFVTKAENSRRFGILIACIIVDTLCLAMGIWSIKVMGDLEEGEDVPNNIKTLKVKIAEKHAEYDEILANLEKFAHPLGWQANGFISSDRIPTGHLEEVELKRFLDHWIEELRREGVSKYTKWGEGGNINNGLTLTKLYLELEERITHYETEISKLKNEIKNLETQEKTTLEGMYAGDKEVKDRIEGPDGRISEYKNLLTQFTNQERQHATDIAGSETQMREELEKLTNLKKNMVRTKQAQEAARAELNKRINWIVFREEAAKERKEPDGRILEIDTKMQVAWIDLTHGDRLFKGTKFKVYSLRKGGEKIDKGEVEVIAVGKDRSKVAVTKLFTEEDLESDDRIYNVYFEPGTPRKIAFAGRFTGKLSNIEAARAAKHFGDVYQEQVDENTNYLVIGEGYEDDPNYTAALKWGVKLILERYFYDYLGIP